MFAIAAEKVASQSYLPALVHLFELKRYLHEADADLFESGHFLQVCPTNLDPTFDLPPNKTYQCPICRKWGKHYSSLCPMNEDPFSIIQKRKALGIVTPGDSKSRDGRILKEWENNLDKTNKKVSREGMRAQGRGKSSGSTLRESPDWSPPDETPRSSSAAYSPPGANATNSKTTKEINKRLREVNEMKQHNVLSDNIGNEDVAMIRNNSDSVRNPKKRNRAESPDSAEANSRKVLNEKSPSPTKARVLRKKLAEIEAAEERGERSTEDKATLRAELHKEERLGRMNRRYDTDSRKRDLEGDPDDIAADENAPLSKKSKLVNYQITDRDMMDIDQKDLPVHTKLKITKYDEFIQKLIGCRPEMKETVGHVKPRLIALDMWNDDDDRRLKMISIS